MQQMMMNFLNTIQGIKVETIIDIWLALFLILGFILLSKPLAYLSIRIWKWKEKDKKKIEKNSFYQPIKLFFVIFGIYLAMVSLKLPQWAILLSTKAFRISIVCLISYGLSNMLAPGSTLLKKIYQRSNKDNSMIDFIAKIVKLLIYVVAAFFIITVELEYNLNGLIAGIGLGGVILTLAAQDTAKNLFGGVVIFLDKPFLVGDWIETENFEGIVEDITFRSTRIRNFENSLVNIPNSILANVSVINWSKMEKRRYKLDLKLALATPLDTVQRITKKLYFALKNHPNVLKDTIYVNLDEIREDGINILVYVFTDSVDYDSYLEAKQSINLDILQILEREGVELAYPSQTIYLKGEDMEQKKKAKITQKKIN